MAVLENKLGINPLAHAEEVARRREAVPVAELKRKKIEPLHNWVLIRKVEEKDKLTAADLLLPESDGQQKSQLGEVVDVGPEVRGLEIGTQVIYTAFPMTFWDIQHLTGDKNLDMVLFDEVYAKVKDVD